MSLSAGARLGPYEILAPVGAGGMGEVYRARDTRLERIVAIKILPGHSALQADARARFEREAKTISQLQDPHICTLHDVGESAGTAYLVMEYLDGETLADRLTKRALPIPDALAYAIQIAEALDNAHRKGIVHRDLKPGNVMLVRGHGGQSMCKLLDFGLAKLAAPKPGIDAGVTVAAPSLVAPLTGSGTILGTFQYMAPEQIEGAEADTRTDLWAFGCVLYEMLTGRRTFEGKSQASLMAAILERDPTPVEQLQPLTPPVLDRVVQTCLAKNPADRFQSAHDLLLQLRWIADGGAAAAFSAAPARRSFSHYAGWMTAIAVASGATWWFARAPNPVAQAPTLVMASLDAPPGEVFGATVALSPDGRSIAFISGAGTDVLPTSTNRQHLWIRSLDSRTAVPLPNTDGAVAPFWSPDSRSVGFFADNKLRIIAVEGGTPRTISDAVGVRVAGTWNRDDVILFSTEGGQPIRRVSAEGGAASMATVAVKAPSPGSGVFRPSFLPDDTHFVFARLESTVPGAPGRIELGSLDSTETVLVREGTEALYSDGYLLFVSGTMAEAQRFDAAHLKLSGEPFPLVDIEEHQGSTGTNVSAAGSLFAVRMTPSIKRELVWYDRAGRRTGTLGAPGTWNNPKLSPDGRSLVVIGARDLAEPAVVWLYDLTQNRGIPASSAAATERTPLWSPDGQRILFIRRDPITGSKTLVEVSATGTAPERLLGPTLAADLTSWSSDGATVLFQLLAAPASPPSRDLLALDMSTRKTVPFAQTRFDETQGRFSPDGRWVAYVSNESGPREIYVQAFPGGGRKTVASLHGGVQPRWRADGKELFYLAPDRKLMAVPVLWRAGAPSFGTPVALFETKLLPDPGLGTSANYDVTPDGQRFIVASPVSDSSNEPITLLVNWTAALAGR